MNGRILIQILWLFHEVRLVTQLDWKHNHLLRNRECATSDDRYRHLDHESAFVQLWFIYQEYGIFRYCIYHFHPGSQDVAGADTNHRVCNIVWIFC